MIQLNRMAYVLSITHSSCDTGQELSIQTEQSARGAFLSKDPSSNVAVGPHYSLPDVPAGLYLTAEGIYIDFPALILYI